MPGPIDMKQAFAIVAIVAIILAAAVLIMTNNGTENEDGYFYAIYTDSEKNLNVIDVCESHYENGTATVLSHKYRSADGPSGIDPFWSFDDKTGVGPFDAFYAAINISDDTPLYTKDDSKEKRLSSSAGRIAYRLDPSDLTRTMNGYAYSYDLYNIMLMIPTVYWTSEKVVADRIEGNLVEGQEYNVLYMSSKASYKVPGKDAVTGMVPYAHSAGTVPGENDFTTNVYPYLGIGVYESYVTEQSDCVAPGLLVSQRDRIPASGHDVDSFKVFADALTPAKGPGIQSDYQQWNFYQWTLYKMMCYTVMGSKNSQIMIGAGYTEENGCSARTGSTDSLGFMGVSSSTVTSHGSIQSGAGKTAAKLFIENGWGSLNEFLGDTFVIGPTHDGQILHTGNSLGGRELIDSQDQPSTERRWADVFASGEPQRIIAKTSADAETWDMPLSSDANRDSYSDPDFPGDIANSSKSGVSSVTVGGRWDNTHFAGVTFACAGYGIDLANQYRGARLVYLYAE